MTKRPALIASFVLGGAFIIQAQDTDTTKIEFNLIEIEEPQPEDPPQEPFMLVERMPHYKECASGIEDVQFSCSQDSIYKHIMLNTNYPIDCKEAGISGVVYVRFVVDSNDQITNSHIMRGAHPSLDAEAIRVVSSIPAMEPGRQRGRVVPVYMTLPISFKMHE